MSKDPSIPKRNKVNWHYVRDDHMFSTIKLPKASVSSSDTSITSSTVAASPRLIASVKGKQTVKASKAKSLSALSEVAMTEAQQLKLVTKRSMQQKHISQASGSGADEGNGSIPGVLDVPTDESEEELSWNSTDDEGADDEGKDGDDDEEDEGDDGEEGNGDDDDDQEVKRDDDKDDEEEGGDDDHEYDEGTKDEESFDPIPKTLENSDDEGNGDEDLGLNSDRLRDEAQRENYKFLKTVDENIQKIIKEQVKEQVKVQVSKILPRIKHAVNEKLEAEVLTRSSNSSKTSYAVAAVLSEMELKKILIEKMEGNKSIQRSDEQRNLYKALVNPEGQQYPHNLLKPLPLIPNNQSRRVIPFEHFINNDLEYLCRGASSQKYTTSITKTKAADYVHIKWIEDLVPKTMWIEELIGYDKHALWEVSYWRRKHQQFYGFAVNQESTRDVYSKRRIIAITKLKIVEWHNYKHLDWITVRRDDDKLYKFKEGNFKRLRIQDIKDMLLLLLQGKLTNLTVEERFAFNVSL
nr:hypothetical protein [Tanacetum cinerariifolium]